MGANDIFNTVIKQRAAEIYSDLIHLVNSHFSFAEINPQTYMDMKHLVIRTIGMGCNPSLHGFIDIRIDMGIELNSVHITSKNLFTLALMYGVLIPAYVRNGHEYTLYRSENGFPSGTTFDYTSQSIYYKERNK